MKGMNVEMSFIKARILLQIGISILKKIITNLVNVVKFLTSHHNLLNIQVFMLRRNTAGGINVGSLSSIIKSKQTQENPYWKEI